MDTAFLPKNITLTLTTFAHSSYKSPPKIPCYILRGSSKSNTFLCIYQNGTLISTRKLRLQSLIADRPNRVWVQINEESWMLERARMRNFGLQKGHPDRNRTRHEENQQTRSMVHKRGAQRKELQDAMTLYSFFACPHIDRSNCTLSTTLRLERLPSWALSVG